MLENIMLVLQRHWTEADRFTREDYYGNEQYDMLICANWVRKRLKTRPNFIRLRISRSRFKGANQFFYYHNGNGVWFPRRKNRVWITEHMDDLLCRFLPDDDGLMCGPPRRKLWFSIEPGKKPAAICLKVAKKRKTTKGHKCSSKTGRSARG